MPLSAEVAAWFGDVAAILAAERGLLAAAEADPRDRRRVMDRLGGAFSDYRARVYADGFSGRAPVAVADVLVSRDYPKGRELRELGSPTHL